MLDILRQGAQSWMIKVLFGIIIAVFVLAFGMNRVDHDRGTTVATVNGEPILFQQFQDRLQRSLEMVRAQSPGMSSEMLAQMGFKRQIFEQMVVEELLLQKAAELGVTVSREELAREVHMLPAFRNEAGVFDPAVYQSVLQNNHLTPGVFEADYMRGMLMTKMRGYIGLAGRLNEDLIHDFFTYGQSKAVIAYRLFPWEDYRGQVNATDEQVSSYYENHKSEYAIPAQARVAYLEITPASLADLAAVTDQEIQKHYDARKEDFKVEEEVKARHLLVRVAEDAPEEDVKKAMEKIETARKELQAGKKFADVAGKYTEDPSGTDTGGALGWFGRGRMVKPFEDAAFGLEKGAVSEPVRTQFGFHLIEVEDKKPAYYRELSDVSGQIRERLAQDRAAETLQDRLDQALEMLLAGETLQAVAKSIGLRLEVRETAPFSRQQGPGELPGLSAENAEALFDLAVNSTTQAPLMVQDGYLLATKLEQTPELFTPLEEVRQGIKETIVREEALKLAKAAADKALPGLKDGGENATLKETEPFGRQDQIPGLGMVQPLTKAAFGAAPGTWLPESYAVPEGYVLAKTVRVTPPTEEEWEAEKTSWIESMNRGSEQQAVQAFLTDLRNKADVRIINPAVLEN